MRIANPLMLPRFLQITLIIALTQVPAATAVPKAAGRVPNDPQAVEALSKRSMVELRAGRRQSAFKIVNEAIRLSPDNPKLLPMRAGLLNALGRPAEALRDCRKAEAAGLINGNMYAQAANAYLLLNQPTRALPYAQKAQRFAPNEEDYYDLLYRCYINLKSPEKAREWIRQGTEKCPWSNMLFRNYIEALLLQNKLADALKYADTGVESMPRSITRHWYHYLTYMRLKDFENAGRALDQVLPLIPASDLEVEYKSIALRDRGTSQERLAFLNQQLKKNPSDYNWLLQRADVLIQEKRFREADLDCRKAIRMRPGDGASYALKGVIDDGLGKHDQAERDLTQAIRLSKPNRQARCVRAMHYLNLRQNEKALADFNTLLDNQPVDARTVFLYANRADVLTRLHLYHDALNDLEAGLKIQPEQDVALTLKARILARLRRSNEGRALMIKLLQRHPLDVNLFSSFAYEMRCYASVQDALDIYKMGIGYNPRSVKLYTERAAVYEDLDEGPRALDDLNSVIRIDPDNVEAYRHRAAVYNQLLDRHDLGYADLQMVDKLTSKLRTGLPRR